MNECYNDSQIAVEGNQMLPYEFSILICALLNPLAAISMSISDVITFRLR